MGKNIMKRILLLLVLSIMSIQITTYAHSGRTDSQGGHKDNKNKSGLGSYHYHCGGHPAHLHTNGICPYSSNVSSSKKSKTNTLSKNNTSSSSESSKSTTSSKPTIINVTSIQINENIESLEIGKSKKLTTTIMPSNATNKNIIWRSSDENIATISEEGVITAKKKGLVDIIATSSNGKTNKIQINIREELKKEKITSQNTTTTSAIINNNVETTSNKKDTNPLGEILALGILGGGGYWGYKKYKKVK